jgi:hypothetical protein
MKKIPNRHLCQHGSVKVCNRYNAQLHIYVYTTHNTHSLYGGRHNYFEDPMLWSQDIKNKNMQMCIIITHTD